MPKPRSVKELLEQTKKKGEFSIPPDAEEVLETKIDCVKPKEVIGLSKKDAERLIKSRGMLSRVTRDGKKWNVVTADFNPERLNLEIENEKVVNAAVG